MLNGSVCEKKQKVKPSTSLTYILVSLIAGFVTASTSVAGLPSTLNVAVCASLGFSGSIAVAFGSIFSYLFLGQFSSSIGYICALLTIVAIKFVGKQVGDKNKTVVIWSLTAGLLYVFYSTGFLFLSDYNIVKQAVVIVQGLIAGCSTYFLSVVNKYINEHHALPVTGFTGASLGVTFVLLITSLCSIDLWRFNLGRVLGILAMLIVIRKYNFIGGAIAGVVASCGIILCSADLGKTAMFLATAGIIAGFFMRFGSVAMVFSFILSNFVGLIVLGISTDTFNFMFDIAIGTVIFIIIPSRTLDKAFEMVGISKYSGAYVARNAGARLDFASKTIHDVNLSLKEVTDAMEQKKSRNPFVSKVCKKVCDNCPNNIECWQEKYTDTICSVSQINKLIKNRKCIPDEFFLQRLTYCANKNELKNGCYESYAETRNEAIKAKNLKDMRDLMSDQFNAMEEMLTSLGKQLTDYSMCDQDLSDEVSNYLSARGIDKPHVCVYKNEYGYIEVEAFVPDKINFRDEALCCDLSDILDVELELPHYNKMGGTTRVELWQKPEYEVETGASQVCGSSGEMTGDSYETFFDNQAQEFIVLSDGMGSGKKAQLDSLMASSLISRLIRAGIGYSSAIRFINSSMRVKSWEESFATVDIAVINLYNSTLNIIKAGAAATYLLRNDQLRKINVNSLPIGILKDINIDNTTLDLKDGDVILTSSDGLLESSLENVRKTIIANKHLNSEIISRKIISVLKAMYEGKKSDDITIIVSKYMSV